MASEGVVKLSNTKLIQSINGRTTSTANQSAFRSEFAKHFNVLKSYDEGATPQADTITYKPLKTGGDTENYAPAPDTTVFFIADGSIYYMTLYKDTSMLISKEHLKEGIALGSKKDDPIGDIMIDVNGKKEPNQWGRDVFWFDINNDGRLIPLGGIDNSLLTYKNKNNVWQKSGEYYCVDMTQNGIWGYGCTARIIEEGWQMNY